MENNRTVNSTVVESMEKNNQLQERSFRLHEGFSGEYTTLNVVNYQRNKESSSDDAFRVQCKGPKGYQNISGYFFMNAYIVPKDTKLPETGVFGKSEVWYEEVAESAMELGTRIHSVKDGDGSLTVPDTFKVLGAIVEKSTVGDHPRIPLREYMHYKTMLRVAQEEIDPETKYLTRDLIDAVLSMDKSKLPQILHNYKEPKLRNHSEAIKEMERWFPTLLIEDWR